MFVYHFYRIFSIGNSGSNNSGLMKTQSRILLSSPWQSQLRWFWSKQKRDKKLVWTSWKWLDIECSYSQRLSRYLLFDRVAHRKRRKSNHGTCMFWLSNKWLIFFIDRLFSDFKIAWVFLNCYLCTVKTA